MIQEIERELKAQKQKQIPSVIIDQRLRSFWYLKIMPISIKNNSFVIATNTIISAISLVICLYYGTIDRVIIYQSEDSIFSYFFSFIHQDQLSEFLIITAFILQIYAIQSIFLYHVKKMQRILIISSINRFMDEYLPTIFELNILLIYLSFLNQNLLVVKSVCFVIANLTLIFSEYFLMPKNDPDDFLYTTETSFMVLFRCSFLTILVVCLLDYYNSFYFASIIACFIISIFFSYKFYKQGSQIFYQQTSAICFNITYSLFISVISTISFEIFMPIDVSTPLSLFLMIILKIASSSNQYQDLSIFHEQLTLDSLKAFIATNKRLYGKFSQERKSLLIGQIQIHISKCLNHNCFSKNSHISSKQLAIKIKINNIFLGQEIETVLLFYTKCLFEELLHKHPRNVQILICYSEYLLYEMKLVLPLSVPICQLEQYKLNLSQQIRFQNLKDSIKQFLSVENQVNEPNFIIQEVIGLQKIYSNLQQKVKQIILRNIDLWQSFNNFASENQILKNIQEILDIKISIKEILMNSQHFHRHLGLKKLVSFYQLYLNNQWKKQKMRTALSSNITKIQEQKDNRYEQAFYQTIIAAEECFNPNTIVISAKISLTNILIIQKTSKSITNLLSFDSNELNCVEINVILPQYLRQQHRRLMCSLIDDGFVSNEKSLKPIRTQCLKKDQTLVSVCKSFKTYANIYGQVQFACIIKVDPIQPILIISNMQNKILQNSHNFYGFLKQQQISASWGLTNRYYDILQEIRNVGSINNGKFSDDFIYLKYQSKSIKFHVKKVEYLNQQPILIITIVVPYQFNHAVPSSQSLESFNEVVQKKIQKTQKQLTNVFMKEQNFHLVQNLPKITFIKRIFYMFGLIYLSSPMLLALIFKYNSQNVLDIFDRQVFFIKFLKQPFAIGILSYQIQMQLSDYIQHLNHHVEKHQTECIQNLLDPIFRTILFDKSIFNQAYMKVKDYYSQDSQSLYFEAKDVIFSLGSFISTYQGSQTNMSKQQFSHFNVMLISFYSEFQNVKNRLFQAFYSTSNFLLVFDIISVLIMVTIFAISLALICSNFYKLSQIWTNLLKILSNTKNQCYLKALTYWKTLKILLPTQQQIWNMKTSAFLPRVTKNNEKLVHNYQVQKPIKNQQTRILYFGILAMVIMLAIFLGLQYFRAIKVQNIRQFQEYGASFLKGYPSNLELSYCLLQRHYNQTVMNFNHPQQNTCQEFMDEFRSIQKIQYIAYPSQNTMFYLLIKEYFFDNPCKNIPIQAQQEDYTYQQCSTYAQGHLSNGILAFERYTTDLVQNVLNDSLIFQKYKLNSLIESLEFADSLMEQMLRVWSEEYHSRTQSLIENTIILNSIATAISAIIYYYFVYGKFLGKIAKVQNQYKQAYWILMTNNRIQKDKIAQSKLLLQGFLQRK